MAKCEHHNSIMVGCKQCFLDLVDKANQFQSRIEELEAEKERLKNKLAFIVKRFPEVRIEIELMEQALAKEKQE